MPGASSQLLHRTVFASASIAKSLPLTPDLLKLHAGGCFPLARDPVKDKRATIIGMLVLRQAFEGWKGPLDAQGLLKSGGWAYGIDGIEGAGVVSGGVVMDGYRLALQYACTDAVLVGSGTAAREQSYLWQPYTPLGWPHLREADPHLGDKLRAQRKLWQELGYLSPRSRPAQIIITQSGDVQKDGADFLNSRAVRETLHADGSGEEMEVYLLTSVKGAERIRQRAPALGIPLERLDKMILSLSPESIPNLIDVAAMPSFLFSKLGVMLANHDGGPALLRSFLEHRAIDQLNLTFCRGDSLLQSLGKAPWIPDETKERISKEFRDRVQMLDLGLGAEAGCLPTALDVVYLMEQSDTPSQASVATLALLA